ncbi:4-(cytidine 5'-diphospho)-2-C-methyl-D-erythritol kinase [Geobacter sp. DSM 9736]|uniref:4-(cytidine 5'-diphospho)-2-C-methyl-D-erythritol kinase n=1 Tax=Geobacter sp. DSM 9736 TaxID=1277350 RepID=UPI000B50B26D|nr:4-(cytidine 5'-diphospho)-2-C-methyl-D-erythritol kinase [Geobacter sp. DSM 9736]SNB48050.1 4-diphosphocytidyl-2-C-methyl-D-erythritol kinase [Geobacter sp. DSM 9736]
MRSIELTAPAKINFRLDVLRRRPDGYHDLRMIMQRIDLCDRLSIALTDEPGIRVTCGREGVPDGPGNIAWRAASVLLELSGKPGGVGIDIVKNIPVAAGLGGGSSDCATVLAGLNDLLELGLSSEMLMEIGVGLGADVPFFLYGQTAIAEGIGERLSPVTVPAGIWLVLVNPNVPVSTAWVYQNLQLTKRDEEPILPCFYGSINDICTVLGNDLESVTIPRYPVIAEIKKRLLGAGARAALMSGSGPTVFGIFDDEAAARAASGILAENGQWFVVPTRTL